MMLQSSLGSELLQTLAENSEVSVAFLPNGTQLAQTRILGSCDLGDYKEQERGPL